VRGHHAEQREASGQIHARDPGSSAGPGVRREFVTRHEQGLRVERRSARPQPSLIVKWSELEGVSSATPPPEF
jgi:hypothetical protein